MWLITWRCKQEAANILFAYSSEPTIITYREVSFYGTEDVEYEFETGYGVGPIPIIDSLIGQAISEYLFSDEFYEQQSSFFSASPPRHC